MDNILLIVALICYFLGAVGVPARVNWVALGLGLQLLTQFV